MNPGQLVETYKFWEIAAMWSTERLENELVIARALARGVIVDGLRFQSVDPRWLKSDKSLTGHPYIGYAADPERPPILLRIDSLEHLLAIVRQAATPSRTVFSGDFVGRDDFRNWLVATGQALPSFWFSANERVLAA